MLLKRTWVWLPPPTGQFATISNSSSRELDALLRPPQAPDMVLRHGAPVVAKHPYIRNKKRRTDPRTGEMAQP